MAADKIGAGGPSDPARPDDPRGVVDDGTPTGAVSDELLASLIHDAEIETGEIDGDGCDLSMREYDDGVLAALRELQVRRG